jgi:hypothetical protein
MNPLRRARAQGVQRRGKLGRAEEPGAHGLVVAGKPVRLQLFQRVGERVVADVVEEGGVGDEFRPRLRLGRQGTAFPEKPKGGSRQVVDPQGVVEPGMGGPGIDQVGKAQLPDVAKPLVRRGVHQSNRHGVEANGVPERIPDDPGSGGVLHGPSLRRPRGRSNAAAGRLPLPEGPRGAP